MPSRIDSHGEIDTFFFGDQRQMSVGVGDRIQLVFRAIDSPNPPIGIVIKSPNGQKIVDRVLRELPTGQPQSAPPVEFIPSQKGDYDIDVKELRGKQRGTAKLSVE